MTTTGQLLRYGTVGAISNVLLYVLYLLLTFLGAGHKSAMTLVFAIGVAFTFILNRNWTFRHNGEVTRAFAVYCLVYFAAYLLNLLALYILVDFMRLPHQVVQGCMIVLIAIMLFFLQKNLAFKEA